MPDALPQTTDTAPSGREFAWRATGSRSESQFTGDVQSLRRWGKWKGRFEWDLIEQPEAMSVLAFLESRRFDQPFTLFDPARPLPRGTARNSAGAVANDKYTAVSVTFDAETATLTKSGGWSLIAEGQEFIVTGTSNNNGTYRALSIASNVLTIQVGTDGPELVDEVAASTTIEALQYGTSLKTSGWPINQTELFKVGDLFGLADTGEVFTITTTIASDGSGLATLQFAQLIRASPANGEAIVCEAVPVTVVMVSPFTEDCQPPLIHHVAFDWQEQF